MFTFKSSSVEEETPEKPEDGITDKEMEDLASILAEKILQVKQLLLQYLSILSVLFTFMFVKRLVSAPNEMILIDNYSWTTFKV